MDFKIFTLGSNDAGRRLDRVVRCFFIEENLSSLYKAIRNGLIKINGKKVRPEYRIQENDELSIATFLVSSPENQKKNAESVKKENQNSFFAFSSENTVFKNDDILVINKPYDTNVQGKDSLAEQIAVLWKSSSKSSQSLSFMPGPLHRLDRKTTGLLVFSQSLKGARWFSSAIAEHKIEKTYIALLEGSLPEKCLWKDKIVNEQEIIEKSNTGKKNHDFFTVKVFPENYPEGKIAVSQAEPIAYGVFEGKAVTLVRIKIETGRKHQIRSQAAFHGFPLLGDEAYGGSKINESQDFFLHAYELKIPKDNPLGLPEKISCFILTNFKKMLNKTLINSNCLSII